MADLNVDELARAIASATISAQDHARSLNDYAAASAKAAEIQDAASKKTVQALKDFSKVVGTSAVDFSKAMATGSEGTAKYSGAITGAADAAGNAAATMLGAFGPLGIIVGGVIKAFGALMGASLKQNDQLMKSYRELSEVGSVSGSLEKLQSDLNRVGLTTEEAEKFGKLLGKNSNELSSFGGSVSAGKDKFIGVFEGMIGVGNKTEIAMQRIGYSANDMRDATADYVSKQSRLGLAQGKTTEQLRTESAKYMVTLRELGELTGMSRDEAQKIMDQQQADARFSITLRQMEMEGKGDEARRLQAYMATYEKTFGKDAAQGLMEQIVNKGAIVGEASAKAFTSTQGKAYEMAERVAKGQASMQEGLSQTAVGVRRNLDQVGSSLMIAGKGAESYTGTYEQINGALAIENKKNIDVAGKLAAIQQQGGVQLNKNIDIEQRAREVRLAADKLLLEVGNGTVSMFEKLTDIMFKFGKFLAQTIDKLSSVIPGMTQTNLSEGFKDKDDFQNELNVAKNEKKAAEEKAALIKKDFDEISKDITGKALKDKIKELEKQVVATQGVAVINEANEITGGIEGRDEVANAEARFRLEQLKALKEEITTRSRQTEIINIDRINAIKQRELLKLENKNAEADQKIKTAQKSLSNFTAVGNSASATAAQNSAGGAVAAAGPIGSKERTDARTAASAGLTQLGAGREDDILKKLKLKGGPGGQAVQGGKIDPALLALAEKIQNSFPGSYFSALNDLYHKDDPNSNHTRGKALDFVLPEGLAPKTAEEAKSISTALEDLGGIKVRDEYFKDKNNKTTGNHFHVEVARNGGAFSGPDAGYPVMLHGKNDSPESVWPEKKLKGMLDEVKKGSIEDYKKELLADMNTNKPIPDATAMVSNNTGYSDRMMEILTAKFDDMINQLETSNGTLRNILTYTQA